MRTRSRAPRATFGLVMAVGLLTMAVVSSPADAAPTASAAPHSVHRAYTRTIEPFYPGHEATSPPSVLPTVACVRRVGRGQLEAVFGWDNPGPLSQEAPLDYGLNEILHRKGDTTTDQSDGPQAEEFLPGHHPYAWALRFAAGEVPSWQLVIPPLDQTQSIFLWSVTVTPTFRTWCGPDVPRHFAAVQSALTGMQVVDKVRDADGNVVSYRLAADLAPVTTVCSPGGTPLPAVSVMGWSLQDQNLVPLRHRDVIRTVQQGIGTWAGGLVQKTFVTMRSVVDPQVRVHLYGPSRDVYGACRFRDGSVARALVYWSTPEVYSEFYLASRDGGPVDVQFESVAPGGTRLR